MPYLIGENIMLRDYRREDIDDIRKWVNQPESIKYLSSIFWFPQTIVDSEEFLNRMLQSAQNAACFVIADKETQSYIGQLDIFTINWKLRCGTIGMVIGDESRRGMGIGTEALGLVTEYGFSTLGLERLEIEVDMENERAKRCYAKAGFVMEGVKRHAYFRGGEFKDIGVLSMLSGEWRARKK